MRTLTRVVAAIVLFSCCCSAQTNSTPATTAPSRAGKTETSHLAFVTEYIRELAAIENIRVSGEKELKQDPNAAFSSAIHTSTLFQLELQSQIRMLKVMHLNDPFDDLIPSITAFYERKIDLWQRITDISSAMIAGPKPGVDYAELFAEMPKIRAQLDYIDKALFEATPLVFATLTDPRPNSKNQANHLIITKAERAKLISTLNTDFGPKLGQKDQNYTVSAASVLKAYLLKDFKCSDEPWD